MVGVGRTWEIREGYNIYHIQMKGYVSKFKRQFPHRGKREHRFKGLPFHAVNSDPQSSTALCFKCKTISHTLELPGVDPNLPLKNYCTYIELMTHSQKFTSNLIFTSIILKGKLIRYTR